jgi:pyruvate formate lyase activating enzyme
MRISGIEKLSLVDYPGYCCAVIFTGGCNFLCPFCHNSGLVEGNYQTLDNDEIMAFLKKRFGMLEAVVISGGEPTLQHDLIDFIREIKAIGYKVKLDTNGTNPKTLKKIVDEGLVDYVAMDIKNAFELYPQITGKPEIDIHKIRESVEILKSGGVDYEFRTTLVKQYHDKDAIRCMAQDIAGAKRVYLQHFVDNDNCISAGLNDVSKVEAEEYKSMLSDSIGEVLLRGY